jgi:hypothetical protein
MKRILSIAALGVALFCAAAGSQAKAPVRFDITLQDESGIETHILSGVMGSETQRLDMAAGIVEIQPPATDAEPAVLKLYAKQNGKLALLHTARIMGQNEARIGYLLCGATVTYYSPKPDQLGVCP